MASGWISQKVRKLIYARDSYTCCYCGETCCHYNDRIDNHSYATLDHIVARTVIAQSVNSIQEYKQAIKDPKNLITVCNNCNASKNDTDLYVWCKNTGRNYAAIIAEIARRIA